jgi:peptidoglycan/LPS O-acetylase OafA/YrhL
LGVYRPFDSLDNAYIQDTQGGAVTLAVLLSFYLFFPAAVAGAVFLHRRQVPVYPLAVFWGIIMFSVAMTFAQQRYRAIGEPTLVLLTAVLIEEIVRRRRRPDPPEDPAPVEQLVDA